MTLLTTQLRFVYIGLRYWKWHFKRMMCISYLQHVDTHKMAEEVQPMWTHVYGRVWSTTLIFVDLIHGWPLIGFNSEFVGTWHQFQLWSEVLALASTSKLLALALASGVPALASGVPALPLQGSAAVMESSKPGVGLEGLEAKSLCPWPWTSGLGLEDPGLGLDLECSRPWTRPWHNGLECNSYRPIASCPLIWFQM